MAVLLELYLKEYKENYQPDISQIKDLNAKVT